MVVRAYIDGVYQGRVEWVHEYRAHYVVACIRTMDGSELMKIRPENFVITWS